ncbi:hypothetical protein [Cohnella thermotolerans]|uniref:hypothetical protein n=1 Tax=Cohnella thermotolerans TaxID=329858 RepID=UPI0012EC2B9D|nr:hypothetical protein [Cohnella thermotolerans]
MGEQDYVWAEHQRQRLRSVWHHYALRLGKRLEESEELTLAATCYIRCNNACRIWKRQDFA